ncbi:hypothetical protein H0O00_05755 [Candidatus Micrarchaeota archaeon]|nr:hypothetical protein [Candidatus Micrarchaeota archaeon]
MNKCFILVFLLSVFGLLQASQVYVLDLTICKNDTVELNRFGIQPGSPGYFPQVGDYKYEFRIIARNATVLFTQPFRLEFVTYPFPGPNSTNPDIVNITNMWYDWKLPYYKDAAFIQLFHEDKKIFEYELPQQETEEEPDETPEKPVEKPLDSNLMICAACGTIAILILVAYALFRYKGKKGGQI